MRLGLHIMVRYVTIKNHKKSSSSTMIFILASLVQRRMISPSTIPGVVPTTDRMATGAAGAGTEAQSEKNLAPGPRKTFCHCSAVSGRTRLPRLARVMNPLRGQQHIPARGQLDYGDQKLLIRDRKLPN